MKKKKIIILLSVFVILAVLGAARIIYVNSRFPKETYTLAQAGEAVECDGMEYTLISVELMQASDFMEKYQYDDIYDDGGARVAIAWLQVENNSDEIKKVEIKDIVLQKGTWSNAIDLYALWNINGDDFDTQVEPGEKRVIGMAAIAMGAYKNIIDKDTPWILRLTGWPDRKEIAFFESGESEK